MWFVRELLEKYRFNKNSFRNKVIIVIIEIDN